MGFGSADYLHVFTEAGQLAFADRARFYADPSFAPAPVEELISEEYAAKRRAMIGERAMQEEPGPRPAQPRAGGGRHDLPLHRRLQRDDGPLIQSNYRGMGSGMTPPTLGF